MTNEQMNDVLGQSLVGIEERCLASLTQLRDLFKRYLDDTTLVMSDFEAAKKQERINTATTCLIAIRDAADREAAFQAVNKILQGILGIKQEEPNG